MLARFVILVFCMMFSPAMFLGWVYPGMSKYTSMWLNTLLKNAFLAPAYLFMIYISVLVMDKLATGGSFAAVLAVAEDLAWRQMAFLFAEKVLFRWFAGATARVRDA